MFKTNDIASMASGCVFTLGLALSTLVVSPLASAAPQGARADEFSTVAANDPLYRHLTTITQVGWRTAPQGAGSSLTRYEIALETAKAIFTVTARRSSDANWASSASRTAARALRDLTSALAPELKSLDVDVPAALRLCESLLKAPVAAPAALAGTPTLSLPATTPEDAVEANGASTRIGIAPRDGTATRDVTAVRNEYTIPLSQRLRVSTALSGLMREAQDPFGDSAFAPSRIYLRVPDHGGSSEAHGGGVGVSVGTENLRLRTAYEGRPLAPQPWSMDSLRLREIYSPGANATRAWDSGIDVALGNSVTLSGDVGNVSTNAAGNPSWMRYGGGVGISAWENRLSLRANLARLVPEDANLLPSTLAGVNVDVGVTERLKLTLLYQQLFGAPTNTQTDRVVAGGISINF